MASMSVCGAWEANQLAHTRFMQLHSSTFELRIAHVRCLSVCAYAGARVAFGGKELKDHTIPKVYGAIEPTAVFVPVKEILKSEENFKAVTTEVFGPLQVSSCPPTGYNRQNSA